MLRLYLKIWVWELTFGHAVKAISSPGVRSQWSGVWRRTAHRPKPSVLLRPFFCTVNDDFNFCHLDCFYLCLKKDWIWIYYISVYIHRNWMFLLIISCPSFWQKCHFWNCQTLRNMVILVYAGVNNLEIKSIMSSNAFHKYCYRRFIPLHNFCY